RAFEAEQRFFAVAQGAGVFADPDHAAVAAAHARLEAGDRAVLLHLGAELAPAGRFEVEAMRLLGRLRHQLARTGQAEDARHGRIGAEDSAVDARLVDALDGVFEDGAVFLVGGAGAGFQPLVFGEIEEEPDRRRPALNSAVISVDFDWQA